MSIQGINKIIIWYTSTLLIFLSSLISPYPSPYPALPVSHPSSQNTHLLLQNDCTVYGPSNPSESPGLHLCTCCFLCMACSFATFQTLNHLLAEDEDMVVWSIGSKTRLSEFKFQLWLLAVWPQESYLTYLGLCFPICKIGLLKVPT